MAISADSARRYTYADLESFPEDNLRREIIDGELFVNPSPFMPHQRVAGRIFRQLDAYALKVGSVAMFAPMDVVFSDENVVEPDLLFLGADHPSLRGARHVYEAPDLVVEISSPGTRHLDRERKRELYERFGVGEYWFVDLDNVLIEAHVLSDGRYLPARVRRPGETLESAALDGLTVPVGEVFEHPMAADS